MPVSGVFPECENSRVAGHGFIGIRVDSIDILQFLILPGRPRPERSTQGPINRRTRHSGGMAGLQNAEMRFLRPLTMGYTLFGKLTLKLRNLLAQCQRAGFRWRLDKGTMKQTLKNGFKAETVASGRHQIMLSIKSRSADWFFGRDSRPGESTAG